MKSGVVERVRAAGGEVYAVTSEPQSLADRAKEDWDLPFDCIGDPHHEIAGDMAERGWLKLRSWTDQFVAPHTRWEVSHPKGVFQPGVLAINAEQRVLYRWRLIPSRENAGGAVRRPTPEHVWEHLEREVQAPQGSPDAAHDDDPVLDAPKVPFLLFATFLIAHGWFLRPVPFAYQGDGIDPEPRVRKMLPRVIGFLALWVLAFVLLPAVWVAVALAVYAPVLARAYWMVFDRFEDEGAEQG